MKAERRGAGGRWIWAILLLAAGLRLVWLDSVPPALSADEASNAYDGYCLLETGADRWGDRWPVVLRAFGDADYRPALLAYLTVPLQALLGPGLIVTATRLPAALAGVLAVGCLYALARRAFDERTGLLAALLLSVSPWHLFVTRLGHEAALTPLFPVLVLLLLQRGGVPFGRRPDGAEEPGSLRWPWLAAAGAAAGLSQYAYASMRLFMPALLLGVALICREPLRRQLRSGRSRWALAGFLAAGVIVAGPMIHVTFARWDTVNARALTESLFHREPSIIAAVALTVQQYLQHFGPDWLFVTGHPYVLLSPRGFGQLHWYMLALVPLGLVALVRHHRANRVCAVVLLWLLIYPIASATTKGGVHALRAAPGAAVFPLIGAVGLAALLARWLPGRSARVAAGAVTAGLIALFAGRFVHQYLLRYPRDPEVQARYQVEFRLAMDYLRQRRDLFDHVFVSDRRSMSRLWHTSEAYIYPLAYLPVDPAEFHTAPQVEYSPPGQVAFHFIARFGDFTFTINRQALGDYAAAFPEAKILLMARPGEVAGGRVVYALHRPPPPGETEPQPCLLLIAADLGRERVEAVWDGAD